MFRGLSTDIDNLLVIDIYFFHPMQLILLSAGEVKWEDHFVFYLVSAVNVFFIIVCETLNFNRFYLHDLPSFTAKAHLCPEYPAAIVLGAVCSM